MYIWFGHLIIFTDIDECSTGSHGCINGAPCYNTPGSYTCNCAPGWTGELCNIGDNLV